MSPGTEELRVAVIGVGHLGRNHARIYHEMEHVRLVAVVDPDEERAREVAARCGARPYADLEDLARDPPEGRLPVAASLAAPTVHHHALARRLLSLGCHVLVEKPLARTLEEAEDLVRFAGEKKLHLAVGHVERFNPALLAALPYIQDAKYIESRRVAPFSFRSQDISVMLDLMVHDIDIILHLVRQGLTSVSALGARVLSPHVDVANARIEFDGGVVADVTASRVSAKAERSLRVFQSDSYVTIDYLNRRATVYRRSEKLQSGAIDLAKVNLAEIGDPRAFLFGELIDTDDLEVAEAEPLAFELESFLESVITGAEPIVSGRHGLRAMRAIARISETMRVL